MTIREVVEKASQIVLRRDAETLLLHVADRDRAWLLAYPEAEFPPDQMEDVFGLVVRRAAHEPLQYITGRQEFMGLDLRVTPDVLIPRPETELLVEAVLDWVRQQQTQGVQTSCLIDVGTGSGAIALSLAAGLPTGEIWALDLSLAALNVAKQNAERLQLSNRVHLLPSDLLRAFQEGAEPGRKADVVVANPPYVPEADAPTMQPEVRDYEPHLALFAGMDGLEVYRRLVPQACEVLRRGGLLAMEFGFGQKTALELLLGNWQDVHFLDDYVGIPRLVLAVRPEDEG